MNPKIINDARIFKALGDENRLYILTLLQSGEKCACKLLEALNISQPTLSHHMKLLCDANLVIGQKRGKWVHYSLSQEGADYAKKILAEYTKVILNDQSCCK